MLTCAPSSAVTTAALTQDLESVEFGRDRLRDTKTRNAKRGFVSRHTTQDAESMQQIVILGLTGQYVGSMNKSDE